MAEITSTGYQLKTQNEWFDEERQLYLDIDPLWNLDPSTPDGLKLAHDAEVWGALDELGQQAYNSKDPNKATGVDLRTICSLTGTKQSPGTPSNVTLALTGTPGTVIIAGKRVESVENGARYTIDSAVTISPSGTATVGATCTVLGATQASIGTITRIVDTVGGWSGVTNPSVATPGTDAETDSQLRIKRALAVGKPGNNQVDSMLGEVLGVDGVRRCHIYENDTGTTDGNGLPGHSLAVLVDGGADGDVGKAIFIKKNPGVTLHQSGTPISVTVTSDTYTTHSQVIKFGRPTYVDMIVAMQIANDGSLPSDIETQITEAIIDYAAGDFIADEYGVSVKGFDIGEDVPFSRLYAPIMQVLGAYGNSYVQTLTLNGGTSNVVIAFDALSRWTAANIAIAVV